jgi:hypothetical protein
MFTVFIKIIYVQDRVIFHRLENICQCVERGDWPVSHRYIAPILAAADSHSSTPMPGTPTTPIMATSAECSSGAGSNSIMAALDRLVGTYPSFLFHK